MKPCCVAIGRQEYIKRELSLSQNIYLFNLEANGALDWSEVAQLKWWPAEVPVTDGNYISGLKEWQLNAVVGSYLEVNAKKNFVSGVC